SHDLERLRAQVARLTGARVVASRVLTRGLRRIGDITQVESARVGVESLAASGPVAAFCAVGNPRAFFEQLRREGFDLRHARPFPDHHAYTRREVDSLARDAERAGALALLTTAKDAVKLRPQAFPLPCYVVEIELEFEDEALLRRLVKDAMS
ncbi:MAG TPA: tetraacyldisaccharide 4'-kinase, partial [Pyrinomonadaceae bacterium]|nr:tetraacyldisaccharide 4'-kinase [Pyrinomonadaceae bacterium]